VYIGSLHFNITEEDLRPILEPFGTIESINIHNDPETGRSKGFGFVQFQTPEAAKKCLSELNGVELAGRTLKVGLADNPGGTTGSLGELDDDEGGGLALTAQARAVLMAKLGRSNEQTPIPIIAKPVNLSTPISQPYYNPLIGETPCLVLKNMFDPQTEDDPEFDEEIKDDVVGECEKFGKVQHIFVDKSSLGFVFLKMDSHQSALKVAKSLHGRWFAKKMISAELLSASAYKSKFPNS